MDVITEQCSDECLHFERAACPECGDDRVSVFIRKGLELVCRECAK